jgi:serine/threonine protein kinase
LNEGTLSPEQTLSYLLPIAGALAVLHDAGIVHRDVKPSNIFLCQTPPGRLLPKLLDFGLARVISDLRLTRSGVVIGTPLYMAPEHAAGAHVGPPADVWSLGVVLYECLSGVSPYNSTDSAVIATQIMAGKIRPLDEVCSGLPQPFAHAVERALRRDLEHRYRDMRDLARALLAGALAGGIRVPEEPDPIGLPDFRGWRHISQPIETADGGEHPSSLLARGGLKTRPVSRNSLRSRRSSQLIGVSLAVIVTLSITLVLWLFGHRPVREHELEPARHTDIPSSQERTVLPVVTPMEAVPGSTDQPSSAAPTRLAPIATEEAPPETAQKRPPRRSSSPSVTPNGARTTPKLDVETEWK